MPVQATHRVLVRLPGSPGLHGCGIFYLFRY